jgi:hypothetical protein
MNNFAEIIRQGDAVEFLHVFQTLADEDVPGLPPGGGLSAKYVFKALVHTAKFSCIQCHTNSNLIRKVTH